MRKLILLICLLLSTTLLLAQTDQDVSNGSLKDRIYVGGNLGLQFGTITNIEVSPVVGYRFTNDFSAGLGITYIYFKQEISGFEDFETNIYGYRLFARHNIQQQFYAMVEYENLSLERFSVVDGRNIEREWIPGMFLGGGYFQPIGSRAGFNIAALYNVLFDEDKSPYNSPWVFRVGVTLGF